MEIFGMPIGGRTGHEAAYVLLDRAYRMMHGGPLPPVTKTAAGKPYFLRGGPHFSLTHTKTMAFCALSRQPVGVDAETVRPVRPLVAARTMNPLELAWLEAQEDPDRGFLTLWTAKEAWVKLTGEGLNGRPKQVELTFGEAGMGVTGRAVRFYTRELEGTLVTACLANEEDVRWTLLLAEEEAAD